MDELKNKIFSGEFDNPTQEYERAKKEHERLYKPQIIIDVNQENMQRKEKEQERSREKHNSISDKREVYNRNDDGLGSHVGASTVPSTAVVSRPSRPVSKARSIDSMSNDDASAHETMSNASSRYSRHDSESRDYTNADDIESMSPATPQGFAHAQTNDSVSTPPIMPTVGISLNLGANAKKKKIESAPGVFSADDDNDDVSNSKKRKLVPLGMYIFRWWSIHIILTFNTISDYDDNQAKQQNTHGLATVNPSDRHDNTSGPVSVSAEKGGSSAANKKHGKNDTNAVPAAASSKKDESSGTKVHDEKRRHIKSIIDRIPTQKEDLFNYKLDRNEIDNNLMERKIRPWINKKIIEYIGEPEPTLVDFICSKVLAGSSPQSILDDVQMVIITFQIM